RASPRPWLSLRSSTPFPTARRECDRPPGRAYPPARASRTWVDQISIEQTWIEIAAPLITIQQALMLTWIRQYKILHTPVKPGITIFASHMVTPPRLPFGE